MSGEKDCLEEKLQARSNLLIVLGEAGMSSVRRHGSVGRL